MADRNDWLALAARCQEAMEPDREIDREIAFHLGVGVEQERQMFVVMGHRMWAPDREGLSPYERARGDHFSLERVGRSRRFVPRRFYACKGPMPLTDADKLTCSLDAIVSLIERELPGAGMDLSKYWLATPESPVWSATLTFGIHGEGGRSDDRPTPAIALCAAFCLAMAEKERVNG